MTKAEMDFETAAILVAFDTMTGEVLLRRQVAVQTWGGSRKCEIEASDCDEEAVRREAARYFPNRRVEVMTLADPQRFEEADFRINPKTRELVAREEPCDYRHFADLGD